MLNLVFFHPLCKEFVLPSLCRASLFEQVYSPVYAPAVKQMQATLTVCFTSQMKFMKEVHVLGIANVLCQCPNMRDVQDIYMYGPNIIMLLASFKFDNDRY